MTESKAGLFSSLQSKLGMDVTTGLQLPMWLHEPSTHLTRMGEMLHFADLLNEAAKCENSLDRMAYVAVFAITGYNGTQRYGKPFDSLDGETFEYVDPKTGVKFFAEQISREPAISACHAENEHFVFYQYTRPKSKFNGNSLDVDTCGKTHIYFKQSRDHFVYTAPPTKVHNLIIGSSWVDHPGTLQMSNLRTKDTCALVFEECNWLGSNMHNVAGSIKNSEGKDCLTINGKWSDSISVKWLIEGKEPKGTTKVMWKKPQNNALGKFNMTEFALKLLELNEELLNILPPTDSRLRPDRLFLEKGNTDLSGQARAKMDEKLRADIRSRVARGEKEWAPRFFKTIKEDNEKSEHMGAIVYCGDYWEQRETKKSWLEQREQYRDVLHKLENLTLAESKVEVPEVDVPENLLKEPMAFGIRGLSIDFRSYKF